MHSHQTHTTTSSYRVLVTDQITRGLVNGDGRHYESPPQSEQQARSLIAVLVGAEHPRSLRALASGDRRRAADHRTPGRTMTGNASDLDRYLRILAGANPAGRLIEIRSATAHGGMRQTFTPATRPTSPPGRSPRSPPAPTCTSACCFATAAPAAATPASAPTSRSSRSTDPTRWSGSSSTAARRAMIDRLRRFPGHAHAYWQLQEPVDLDELEQANRRLAHPPRRRPRLRRRQLASSGPRPPGMETHPADARRAARAAAARRYQLAELTAGLADPPAHRRSTLRAEPRRDQRRSTGSSSRSPPPPTCQRSPAANPTAPAKSAARSTTTATPASSSTTTAGTASHAASEAPSTTSARSSSASTPAATSSSSSASASPQSCTSPQPRMRLGATPPLRARRRRPGQATPVSAPDRPLAGPPPATRRAAGSAPPPSLAGAPSGAARAPRCRRPAAPAERPPRSS